MKAVLLLASLVLACRPAEACAPAPPKGEEVAIADEEAVIVWDPATKTEHFIRRARFDSTARSFGFLVPTPATPQLGEVDGGVFEQLAWQLAPQVVVDTSGFDVAFGALIVELLLLGGGADKSEGGAPAPVHVIQSVNVAGFQATTIEASDPAAMAAWLGEHGFAETPQLTEWLARYVADRWKITAFVVAGTDPASRSVSTSAVRMTFQTDAPFYPYREPAPIPMTTTPRVTSAGRMLRVFFLANERYAATLGRATPWSARVLHASPITLPMELGKLPGAKAYATVFVDESNPRVATDELYFAPSAATAEVRQTIVERQPTRIYVPVDLILVGGMITWWIVRRRRRHSAAGIQKSRG